VSEELGAPGRDDFLTERYTNSGEDFQRHPNTGAPYVNHPTKVTIKGKPWRAMYGRPSNFGAQIEDRYGINRWTERHVLLGTTLLPREVQAAVGRLDLEDASDRLIADGWVVDAKEQAGAFLAAARGTFVHLATTLDRDEADPLLSLAYRGEDELGVPTGAIDAILTSWALLLERHGLHELAVEQKVVDDRWRLAGTLDRIVQLEWDLHFGAHIIPAGTVLILDIKTGRLTMEQGHPAYWNAYSVQIASYAHSLPYVIDGLAEERMEWPWHVDQRHALIAHLDIGNALSEGVATAQLVHVDLTEGHKAGNLCRQARDWQSSRSIFALHSADPVATTVSTTDRPF
jgi:hypothetical protein